MAPRLLFVMFGAVYYLGLTTNGEPIQKADLKSLHIISDIKDRIATTLVSMEYYNPYNSAAGADLHILMPLKSMILNFNMEKDGQVTVGEVKSKTVAKDNYIKNVRRGQSSGYFEVEDSSIRIFDISVNIEPQKYIVYNLTYRELLTRQNNIYKHDIHVTTGGIIDELLIEVFISEPQDIIRLSVPKITNDKLTNITVDKELESASIEYISSKEIYIKYNPSRKQQEILRKDGAPTFFTVEYDVDHQYISNPSYKAILKSLHIISDIKYRFATTLITMKYYNPYSFSVGADLYAWMPSNSFISNFSMEIDGQVTVGEVKEKTVAKNIYEYTKEIGQSSGKIETESHFAKVFDISVNIEPQKYIVYNLTYQELLTRQNNIYKHDIHVTNGGIIDEFLVEVSITEPQDIIHVSVPKITNNKLKNITVDKELDYALIKSISSREVYIKYNPSRKQQEEIEKDGAAGLLEIQYDVDRQNNSNLIYAVDGYFVHFFTSDSIPKLPKYIIFMLDVSASMSGRKIEQMSKALKNILDQLDPELDKFLIGKFSNDVSWMNEDFLIANECNKKLGQIYTKSFQASGSTNTNAALLRSIEKHKSFSTPTKKSIIVFLTSGYPTEGVTDREQIKKNFRDANEDISLFTLCFGGKSINNFFRKLATENGGFNRKIYLGANSELQIENLYKEISNILLKNIKFVYLDGAVNTSSTSFSNYFKGSELVVSGVLPQKPHSTISVNVRMTDHLGPNEDILELKLYRDDFNIYDDGFSQNSSLTSIQSLSEISEKTYAYLTLTQLLKKDKTKEVRRKILELALKYNFVTPLTSMIVTKHKVIEELFEEDENLPSLFENKAIVINGKAPEIPQREHSSMLNGEDQMLFYQKAPLPPHRPARTHDYPRFLPKAEAGPLFPHIPARTHDYPRFLPKAEAGPLFPHSPDEHSSMLNGEDQILVDQTAPLPQHSTGQHSGMLNGEDQILVDQYPRFRSKPETAALFPHSPEYPRFRSKPEKAPLFPHSTVRTQDYPRFRSKPETAPLPQHSPGILIKPLNCSSDLCFTDSIQCRNKSQILLLADEQANVSVYGYVKNASNTNCLDTLNRVDIITPSSLIEIVSGQQGAIFNSDLKVSVMTPTFSITVNQYINANVEAFLSVRFNILDKLVQASGMFSDYVSEFECIENPPDLMTLSNKTGSYAKVIYYTADGMLSHCFSL